MNLANFDILNRDEASLSETDGMITIATNGGWMWRKGNTSKNLLLSPQSQTEATVEISVELLPVQNGEQVGIVLFVDIDNYIKLVREMVDDQHVIVLAKELDGEPNIELLLPFEPAQVDLTLTIQPDGLMAHWKSADGSESGTQSFPNWLPAGAEFQAGIIAQGATESNQATVSRFVVNGQSH